MEKFDNLVHKLERGALARSEFEQCLGRVKKYFDIEIDLPTLQFFGLPLVEDEEHVYLKTIQNSYLDEVYCVVDIETNGNSPVKNQIIEIGALKYHRGEVIDSFSSFVYADYIPEAIVRLTNIEQSDLRGAPSLKQVLHEFRLFLGSDVFVAHNVRFDYNFISKSLQTIGEDELLNRKLCTVDLARKTIDAERHGLGHLKEVLQIDAGEHHRAYADALSAAKVLDACFRNLPEEVKTTEDLIRFSKGAQPRKKKRAKEA